MELLKTVLRKEETMSLKERLAEGRSPKKAQGSGFGVGPCKTSIFKY